MKKEDYLEKRIIISKNFVKYKNFLKNYPPKTINFRKTRTLYKLGDKK